MNTTSDFDRHAAAWLADGPTELADRVFDAALREVHLTRQRRRWSAPWRAIAMSLRMTGAVAIVIVAIAGIVAFSMIRGVGALPTPTLAPSPATGPSPSPAPVATVVPTVLGLIDTTSWATYNSTRYGFSIGYPTAWHTTASSHAWVFPTDATEFPPSAGETFESAAGDVAVSAWSLPIAPGTSISAWLQSYCAVAEANSTCSTIPARTINVDIEGHSGLLVAYKEDTQAYVQIGDQLYIVGCWRAETDPTVAIFGGATRLLKGFLATLHLPPPPSAAPSALPS